MGTNHSNKIPDIHQTIVCNASIERVWDAVATSEGIAVWFMPNDFKPIKGYEFQLNAGPFGMSPCKVVELEPPNRLSFTWGKDWTVTFELTKLEDDKTEFTLIHSGWDPDTITEFGETHMVVRDRMANGWIGLLKALSTHVEA
ncbi:SRPBCC family protein [Brevibacillus laterosporus]|uniref:SRPBCC domain-containing protein n=1 Tax=Brevibacillus laterosporus TaxID=1465 RepID=A0AAP8QAB1_BRELA|nr:SRPBCC domain-containing protein [Brevibacillus laterosporus]PPA91350.1 SRPBCC domain-containing protein [Brevibacillus laterosporus]